MFGSAGVHRDRMASRTLSCTRGGFDTPVRVSKGNNQQIRVAGMCRIREAIGPSKEVRH